MTGINETLAEREKTYGNFYQDAILVQDILKALRCTDRWDKLDADMKLSIQMIVLKLVRIVQGNPYYSDNWHDIGGYAKLVENRLEEHLGHKDKERSWPWEPASNLLQKEKKKREE